MCQREGKTGVRVGDIFDVSEGGKNRGQGGELFGTEGDELTGEGRIATGKTA